MKTIIINGKELKVSAVQERALRELKNSDFAATRGSFSEKAGALGWRYNKFTLPTILGDVFGVFETYNGHQETAREHAFFKAHPRCRSGVFGNPRRINAILVKLG